MEYFGATCIGKYREKNEDYYYAKDSIFIVADGMGGHRAGEVASKIAVETFIKNFKQNIKNIKPCAEISNNLKEKNISNDIKNLLSSSIKLANSKVYKLSVTKIEYAGMGTTFTCCYIYNNIAYITHVGDSRLYIKRGNDFRPLTSDHTIVGELYRSGRISYEETFNHPQRNFLTNVLGVDKNINWDFLTYKLKADDIVLLCSDGLNSMLRDSLISKIIDKFKNTEAIAKNLIKYANKKGGLDNITVIVIKI